MLRKKLPLTRALPTADAARRRLGGRALTEAGAGEVVTVTTEAGLEKDGVILFVQGNEIDVWIADDTVLRTSRARARPTANAIAMEPLAAIAADARAFGALQEGDRIRYPTPQGVIVEATLVEKCRWGALVLRDDATVVGIGFRRLRAAGAIERN